jgi:small subunit ribosomal protein S3
VGQKVNPNGLRVGIIKNWDSKWYANKKDFKKFLQNDIKFREYFSKQGKESGIAKVEIERNNKRTEIIVHTTKPGIIIGRGGEGIEKIKKDLAKEVDEQFGISIVDIKKPDLNAKLVANSIAIQIQNRAPFRMAQKRAIRNTMKAGAKGNKTLVSGRLNGVDIARSDGYTEGTVPLHTLRADIDYATAEADTTFGKIGVKVWIYKGEILPEKKESIAKGGN